jgi:hypothetical protein
MKMMTLFKIKTISSEEIEEEEKENKDHKDSLYLTLES